MTTITIPKRTSKGTDVITVPRVAYEEFLAWERAVKSKKVFQPTAAERRAIARGRREMKKGNYITFEALRHELGC